MASTLRMRQRIEQSRKTCLMKKVRLYEYLVGYGNFFDPISEGRSRTANSFLPHVNYHTSISAPNSPNSQTTADFGPFISANIQTDRRNSLPLKTAAKTSKRARSFREVEPMTQSCITQLTAKTMTPSTRQQECANFIIRPAQSTARDQKNPPRLSPRRRTYIGGVHYVKDKSITERKKLALPRKVSITPWDIEMQML